MVLFHALLHLLRILINFSGIQPQLQNKGIALAHVVPQRVLIEQVCAGWPHLPLVPRVQPFDLDSLSHIRPILEDIVLRQELSDTEAKCAGHKVIQDV